MERQLRMYTVVTQSFIQTGVLIWLGYMFGTKWWLDSVLWGAVFAVIGAICGVVSGIMMIMKVGSYYDKKESI